MLSCPVCKCFPMMVVVNSVMKAICNGLFFLHGGTVWLLVGGGPEGMKSKSTCHIAFELLCKPPARGWWRSMHRACRKPMISPTNIMRRKVLRQHIRISSLLMLFFCFLCLPCCFCFWAVTASAAPTLPICHFFLPYCHLSCQICCGNACWASDFAQFRGDFYALLVEYAEISCDFVALCTPILCEVTACALVFA